MNLIPWKLFETESLPTSWAPAMDIQETDKDFTVRVELPGVDLEAVELTVENNLLTLRGEKKDVRDPNNKGFQRSECLYGAFERSLLLPEGVDAQAVTADGARGVLSIHVPKAPAAAARRIQVKST